MDRPKLNLVHFSSFRERELLNRAHDTEFERLLRGEVNLFEPAGCEHVIRQAGPLAQDLLGCAPPPPERAFLDQKKVAGNGEPRTPTSQCRRAPSSKPSSRPSGTGDAPRTPDTLPD